MCFLSEGGDIFPKHAEDACGTGSVQQAPPASLESFGVGEDGGAGGVEDEIYALGGATRCMNNSKGQEELLGFKGLGFGAKYDGFCVEASINR